MVATRSLSCLVSLRVIPRLLVALGNGVFGPSRQGLFGPFGHGLCGSSGNFSSGEGILVRPVVIYCFRIVATCSPDWETG